MVLKSKRFVAGAVAAGFFGNSSVSYAMNEVATNNVHLTNSNGIKSGEGSEKLNLYGLLINALLVVAICRIYFCKLNNQNGDVPNNVTQNNKEKLTLANDFVPNYSLNNLNPKIQSEYKVNDYKLESPPVCNTADHESKTNKVSSAITVKELTPSEFLENYRKAVPCLEWEKNRCFALSAIYSVYSPENLGIFEYISKLTPEEFENELTKKLEQATLDSLKEQISTEPGQYFLGEIYTLIENCNSAEPCNLDELHNRIVNTYENIKNTLSANGLGSDKLSDLVDWYKNKNNTVFLNKENTEKKVWKYLAEHAILNCKQLVRMAEYNNVYEPFDYFKDDAGNAIPEDALFLGAGKVRKEEKESVVELEQFRNADELLTPNDVLVNFGIAAGGSADENASYANNLPKWLELFTNNQTYFDLGYNAGKLNLKSLVEVNGQQITAECESLGKVIKSKSGKYMERQRDEKGLVKLDKWGCPREVKKSANLFADNKDRYISAISFGNKHHCICIKPVWCWSERDNDYVADNFMLEYCLGGRNDKLITETEARGLLQGCFKSGGSPIVKLVTKETVEQQVQSYGLENRVIGTIKGLQRIQPYTKEQLSKARNADKKLMQTNHGNKPVYSDRNNCNENT